MAKTPKDKLNIDDYDSVERWIADALDEGWTIEGEDFEGEQCHRCGEIVPFAEVQQDPDALIIWDVELKDTPDEYARRYFCSDECKKAAQRAILDGDEDPTPYADGHDEISEEQRKGFV